MKNARSTLILKARNKMDANKAEVGGVLPVRRRRPTMAPAILLRALSLGLTLLALCNSNLALAADLLHNRACEWRQTSAGRVWLCVFDQIPSYPMPVVAIFNQPTQSPTLEIVHFHGHHRSNRRTGALATILELSHLDLEIAKIEQSAVLVAPLSENLNATHVAYFSNPQRVREFHRRFDSFLIQHELTPAARRSYTFHSGAYTVLNRIYNAEVFSSLNINMIGLFDATYGLGASLTNIAESQVRNGGSFASVVTSAPQTMSLHRQIFQQLESRQIPVHLQLQQSCSNASAYAIEVSDGVEAHYKVLDDHWAAIAACAE